MNVINVAPYTMAALVGYHTYIGFAVARSVTSNDLQRVYDWRRLISHPLASTAASEYTYPHSLGLRVDHAGKNKPHMG